MIKLLYRPVLEKSRSHPLIVIELCEVMWIIQESKLISFIKRRSQ
ncbi:hypothetical protein HanHA89_Chr13g0526221 [Helianthus annuus]|nr:hypothetical protein HanHA89_Chr13g0526221 [Helianthus annuus]